MIVIGYQLKTWFQTVMVSNHSELHHSFEHLEFFVSHTGEWELQEAVGTHVNILNRLRNESPTKELQHAQFAKKKNLRGYFCQ
jgi:hypothetical protein